MCSGKHKCLTTKNHSMCYRSSQKNALISVVESTTKSELKAKHGLSFDIETKSHKILFDLGEDGTLFENAKG